MYILLGSPPVPPLLPFEEYHRALKMSFLYLFSWLLYFVCTKGYLLYHFLLVLLPPILWLNAWGIVYWLFARFNFLWVSFFSVFFSSCYCSVNDAPCFSCLSTFLLYRVRIPESELTSLNHGPSLILLFLGSSTMLMPTRCIRTILFMTSHAILPLSIFTYRNIIIGFF